MIRGSYTTTPALRSSAGSSSPCIPLTRSMLASIEKAAPGWAFATYGADDSGLMFHRAVDSTDAGVHYPVAFTPLRDVPPGCEILVDSGEQAHNSVAETITTAARVRTVWRRVRLRTTSASVTVDGQSIEPDQRIALINQGDVEHIKSLAQPIPVERVAWPGSALTWFRMGAEMFPARGLQPFLHVAADLPQRFLVEDKQGRWSLVERLG